MTIHTDLIDWSRSRPKWQQDALRRIAEGRTTREDFGEILELARVEYGLSSASELIPVSLAARFENGLENTPKADVHLRSMRDLTGVNALATGQCIEFAETGITVVYGDNGAGKSGYGRVLKQVCRARGGRPRVYSNVYAPPIDQSAAITYTVNHEERSFTWTPDGEAPRELREVSIFDARCATVYVGEDSDVAYLPYGIDLFPRLTRICDVVRSVLEDELQALKQEFDKWPEFKQGTTVYKLLQRLENSYSTCKALAALSTDEVLRLTTLRTEKEQRGTANPAGRAIELRQVARRVDDVVQRWNIAAASLSQEKIEQLGTAKDAHEAAVKAARAASAATFSDAAIEGLGTSSWIALWRSARAFALEGNYPRNFPPREGESCVLCLQPLMAAPADAMSRFDAFIQGQLQKEADDQAQKRERMKVAVSAVALERVATDADIQQLTTLDKDASATLNTGVQALEIRRELTLQGNYKKAAKIACEDPCPSLEGVRSKLIAEATTLEGAAQVVDLASRDAMLAELEARELLGEALDRLDAQLERERKGDRYAAAISSTSTMVITKFSRELLAVAVTAPLAAEFAKQCKALRLTHIPTSLDGIRGEKGTALHRLSLHHDVDQAAKEDILSEGEHRSIALAAFLAEISIQESMSTLVLDDPVSSLDHGRRGYVALELAYISRARPVVVFTHDLVFVSMLQDAAEKARVTCTHRSMRRGSKAAGFVSGEPPWDALRIKRRIGIMKDGLAKLAKLAETSPETYEIQIRMLYGFLRESWERAVEEILLQEGVKRFAPEIKTQSLRKLHRVTEEQLVALDAGMTKASSWIQGHDHSAAQGAVPPDPDEALADIVDLEQWVASLRKTFEN